MFISDEDTLIIVPEDEVATFSSLRPKALEWLKQNVGQQGGAWCWFAHGEKQNVNYVSFRFDNVNNQTRIDFAKKFKGRVKFKKLKLIQKTSPNNFVVYVPKVNIARSYAGILRDDVLEWLKVNVQLNSKKSMWHWSTAGMYQDINYVSFIFENVDESIATLFKLTFG